MKRLCFVIGALVTLVAPREIRAQGIGAASIVGVVRDTSGAVLPGVTVEAASPVLIEKVRTTVTDAEGRYQIAELRPGAYSVTFTLPGFATFRRDGLELSSNFVATVNADLRVGALEETVVVSGETPLVDVRSVSKGTVVSQETLAVLPTSKSVGRIAGARSRRSVTGQRCRHRRDQGRTVRSHLCVRRPAGRHASDDERHALQQPERRRCRPALLRQPGLRAGERHRPRCRRFGAVSTGRSRRQHDSAGKAATSGPGRCSAPGRITRCSRAT